MRAWMAHRRAPAAPRRLRWRCRRLAAACPVRLVGNIRHATAVVHKVFGQENEPGAPVTSSQGARDTNVRPPNRAWEGRARPAKLAAAISETLAAPRASYAYGRALGEARAHDISCSSSSSIFPLAFLAALRGGRARVQQGGDFQRFGNH